MTYDVGNVQVLPNAPLAFDATKQCHWCGGNKLSNVSGYAGERPCLTCGWGGEGEADVPCMYYRIVQNRHIPTGATP